MDLIFDPLAAVKLLSDGRHHSNWEALIVEYICIDSINAAVNKRRFDFSQKKIAKIFFDKIVFVWQKLWHMIRLTWETTDKLSKFGLIYVRVCIDILKDLHGLFWHTFPVYPQICETKRKQIESQSNHLI